MIKKSILAWVLILLGVPSAGLAGPKQMKLLSGLPAPVQQTIRAQVGNGTLNSVDRDEDGGDLTYDVEMTRNGVTRNFTVGTNGELLNIQAFLSELPSQVRTNVQAQAAGAAIGDIYRSIEEDENGYDVEVIRDGQTRDFIVGANGDLLDAQVFLNELPSAVQKAVQKQPPDWTVGDIYKSIEDGATNYDVDLKKDTALRTVTFDTDGKILSQEQRVQISETPKAVQKSIQSLFSDAKVISIKRVFADGDLSYDVMLRQSGGLKTVSLGPDGKVLADD